MTTIFAALSAIFACACLISLWYAHSATRKVYETVNGLFDDIVHGRKINLPELKEGGIYALSGKAVRIQEIQDMEICKAEQEKKQVKMLVSNMSHQLQTPLANVMLYEDLLLVKKN